MMGAPLPDDVSDEDDDEELLDDARFEEIMAASAKRTAHRGRFGICAESWAVQRSCTPHPVTSKSEKQREQIRVSISKYFLFNALPAEQLEQVLDSFRGPLDFQPGDEVIRQGAEVREDEPALYVLESGVLNVHTATLAEALPGEHVSVYNSPGQSFGEVALLCNSPRTVSVFASTKAVLWGIDRLTFRNIVCGAAQVLRERRDRFLSSVKILQDLSMIERSNICDVVYSRQLQAGEYIIRRGEEGTEFFILEEGKAAAVVDKKCVKAYGAGDYFGELALIECQPRSLDVVALSQTVNLLVLDGASFRRLLGHIRDKFSRNANLYKPPAEEGEEEASEDDGSDNELDDEEFYKLMPAGRRTRRAAVGAEDAGTRMNFRPSLIAKIAQQSRLLKSALSSSFVFTSLDGSTRQKVVDAFQGPHAISAETQIVTQGDWVPLDGPGLYVLESGSVDVYKADKPEEGLGHKVSTFSSPGAIFGELALLHKAPRAATVVASTDVVVWWLDRECFQYYVKSSTKEARERYETLISSCDIFSDLSRQLVRKVADVVRSDVYARGDHIIRKGDEGNCFFIVEAGYAYASLDGQKLKEYFPGGYFGELALLNQQPRSVDVIAGAAPTRVLVLDGKSFRRFVGVPSESMAHRSTESAIEETDDIDDDEEPTEEEVLRCRLLSRRRRKAVCMGQSTQAGMLNVLVNPKSPAHEKALRSAMSRSMIFANLDPSLQDQLISAFAGPEEVKRGHRIIDQGSLCEDNEPGFFVILKGAFDVYLAEPGQPPPGRKVWSYKRPCQYFGELALLHDAPRAASVIAAVDSVVWSLSRAAFCMMVKRRAKMRNTSLYNFVNTVEVFHGLTAEDKWKIVASLRLCEFHKGDHIIRQGQIGTDLFMIEEGTAYASSLGQRLKEYGPGDYFGELALIRREPRKADVTASFTPTRAWALDGDCFKRVLGPLTELLEERARSYAASDEVVKPPPLAPAGGWCCTACSFWNLKRATSCLKCGQREEQSLVIDDASTSLQLAIPRPLFSSPGESTEEGSKPPKVTVLGLDLMDSGAGFVVVSRPELPDVGVVQGQSPLAPGERFQAVVLSRGGFGELGLGLAPHMSDSAELVPGAAKASTAPKVRGMVGASSREVGFHGDHGRWYVKGHCPGVKVSSQWQDGDLIECGLTHNGQVFIERNGERLAETVERWPMQHAYPTASLRSPGASLEFRLHGVGEKIPLPGASAWPPASELLTKLQSTDVGGNGRRAGGKARQVKTPSLGFGVLSAWLGIFCSCQELESADGGGGRV